MRFDLTAIQPFAGIIGAVIGASIGALVTYFVAAKRKKIMIYESAPMEITNIERERAKKIPEANQLLEASKLRMTHARFVNIGTQSISDFEAYVGIEGSRQVCVASISPVEFRKRGRLHDSIKLKKAHNQTGPRFRVSLQYLNPREAFDVELFFDGPECACHVDFLMEDVKAVFRRVGGLHPT